MQKQFCENINKPLCFRLQIYKEIFIYAIVYINIPLYFNIILQNNHKSLFIMTGKELKEILDDLGVVYTQLAEKLGTSQANVSASLKVNDIKTGYIERIAHAIHVPVIYFYDRAAHMGTSKASSFSPTPVNLIGF